MADYKVETEVDGSYRDAEISADFDNNGNTDHVSISSLIGDRGALFARLNENSIRFLGKFDPKKGYTGEIEMWSGGNNRTMLNVKDGCIQSAEITFGLRNPTGAMEVDLTSDLGLEIRQQFDQLSQNVLGNKEVRGALDQVTQAIKQSGKLPSEIDIVIKNPPGLCIN